MKPFLILLEASLSISEILIQKRFSSVRDEILLLFSYTLFSSFSSIFDEVAVRKIECIENKTENAFASGSVKELVRRRLLKSENNKNVVNSRTTRLCVLAVKKSA